MFSNKKIKFFNKNGYLKVNIFDEKDINFFKKELNNKIKKIVKKKINLSNYHKVISQEQNQKITGKNRYLKIHNKFYKKILASKIVMQILKNQWNHFNFVVPDYRYLTGKSQKLKNIYSNKMEIPFRVVVPKKNVKFSAAPPPHVDLNGGKITTKKINKKRIINTKFIQIALWTPLLGFSKNYSLKLAPQTHKIDHKLKALSRENKYYLSPVFKKSYYSKFKFKRIEMKKGQSLLFDGNLIHGGSENLGKNTRISLDFRLYNIEKIRL